MPNNVRGDELLGLVVIPEHQDRFTSPVPSCPANYARPIDQARIQLSDGQFRPAESWVYVWMRPGGEVLYVGATGLPLAARVWLHLNDERPEVGRVQATCPEALEGDVEVRGFAVTSSLDRGAVRDCLEAILAGQDSARSAFDRSVVAEATRIQESLATDR